ncbi:VOC family protein [Lentzea sp. NBRC 105346]|uniref:VOC family protein n=1 Tax=Lentzea sp. NBRC 105346 TaxID=3032205 RepID=UPI0024A31260|nr:VOC family protein [Lentzea sp. NBRC 105346]GLZ29036.1 VOC family protein [Lentzea sp. NBRC 105346]
MASRLNPYIGFKDNARQAMEFYKEVFGGELRINTFGEFGMEGPDADKVMHAMLEAPNGYTIMASDTPPEQQFTPGSQISMSISGTEADELRGYWEALSGKGGTVTVPFEKQMWGDEFGMCVDQFGISWMVNVVAEQQQG